MAKLTLADISAGVGTATIYNANNALVEAALENTLSRDGTSPNAMGAQLDMNSNRIINLPEPVAASDAARLADVSAVVAAGLPTQTGHSGEFLTTDRTDASWGAAEAAGTAAGLIATHEGAANPHPGYLTQAEGDAAYQPLDADLTTLAGSTAAFLSLANDATVGDMRTTLGLGALAVLSTVNNGEWSGTDLSVANGGTGSSTAADARTALGVSDDILVFIIDGGGATITTGVKGFLPPLPFACTITVATALADQSGSIVVDIWKDTYANYPPTDADTITAAAPVTISAATKSQDSTLTGWTVSLAAGDILGFNVDSVTTIQRLAIGLKVTK